VDIVVVKSLVLGGIAGGSLTAGLFFLKFWRTTQDRLFLFFAVALGVEALVRIVLGLSVVSQENEPFFYLLRVVSYGLIIIAVVDKNRTPS
jgi:uncharacterized membrane protein HdeD (DUF308 family)